MYIGIFRYNYVTLVNGPFRCLSELEPPSAGVLLMAKSKAAASGVHAQFRERSVEKTYLAITCGVPDSTDFVVDAPIDRHASIKCAPA